MRDGKCAIRVRLVHPRPLSTAVLMRPPVGRDLARLRVRPDCSQISAAISSESERIAAPAAARLAAVISLDFNRNLTPIDPCWYSLGSGIEL